MTTLLTTTVGTAWRFPDKPKGNMTRQALTLFEISAAGRYFAQAKVDGWRCLVRIFRGVVTYTSRHGEPIPISDGYRAQIEPVLIARFGDDALIDTEWCARRPGARSEKLWLLDLLVHDGSELYATQAWHRFEMLTMLAAHELHANIVPTSAQLCDLYDYLCPGGPGAMPEAEGIVLKSRASLFIGSARECALNPAWTRCKWRGGADGMTPLGGAS